MITKVRTQSVGLAIMKGYTLCTTSAVCHHFRKVKKTPNE